MTTLAHKDHTPQDIIDEMTPEQRDLMDLIGGLLSKEDAELSQSDLRVSTFLEHHASVNLGQMKSGV